MDFISRLPFPVLGVDKKGTIRESNGALERELGLGHSLQNKSIAESVSEGSDAAIGVILDDGASESPVVQLAFAGAVSHPRTFYVIVDGDTRWLVGQPREFDDQRDAVRRAHERAEAQTDEYARISQELLANEQLAQRARALIEASEAKARFLATMSHELRTPLNAVLGYAGLLRDGVYGAVSEQQGRAVQAIVRRAKDLQLLIDDVLDLSKIESGRAELHVDEFDPSAVLEEVNDAIAAFARDKKLRVSVRTRIKRRVRLDRGKYKQVLLNLASNAVKFTPEGGEVELSVEEGDGDSMITSVRDTGIGIAPENLGVIFDDFQQVESGTTRRYQGIGLGLAIVKRTVELLGGSVSVKSEPALGTAFSLRLPIQPVGEALMGDAGAMPDDAALSNDPIIVAIDDDPEVISLLRDSLAPAHFRVVGALNGDRGMELARIVKPFAITLDIMMPEKDGWQVLREVKADPELCRIPVIVMSIVSERSLGFSLGVTDYLVKPVDRRVLIDVLERLREKGDAERGRGRRRLRRTHAPRRSPSLARRARAHVRHRRGVHRVAAEGAGGPALSRCGDAGAGGCADHGLRFRRPSLREHANGGDHAKRRERQPAGMDAQRGGRGGVRGARAPGGPPQRPSRCTDGAGSGGRELAEWRAFGPRVQVRPLPASHVCAGHDGPPLTSRTTCGRPLTCCASLP